MQKSLLVIALAFLCFSSVQAVTGSDIIAVFAGLMNGIIHKDELAYL